eukprot:TRINITY_DN446_c0_g1_i4.p1 TRINITY_DN446_c0_g1~~TRINITY_DN446_c0_g1_i4.p1  ORF type:complete len:140 (-),score=36.37 TRINITY_DN446_c0_g1_i4:65-424(-)
MSTSSLTWPKAIVNAVPKKRTYVVTGDPIYNGVIHGHPRIEIPVQAGREDGAGTVGAHVTITNSETGEGRRIFGVNHWNWTGKSLFIWVEYHQDHYKDSDLAEIKNIAYNGATIVVEAQ